MSLFATRMQNMRAESNFDKNELRPSRYGALDIFMQQSNDPAGILTPELKEKADRSIGRTLEVPVINYDSGISIGSTRSLTIADSENTSAMVTINFTTYAWGFTIVPAMYMNNEISMQRDFERKFNKYLYKFASTLDAAAVARLAADKTQVFGDLLQYTQTGNAVQCPWKLRENLIGDLNPMMAANDHYGQIHLVANTGVESIIRKMAEKGLYNEINKTLEYSDKILHFTNNVTNESGEFGNTFAVQDGCLGVLTRFERECILGTEMQDGTAWGIDNLPLINFPVGTYFYESKGDFSAIAGAATADMDRVRKEHYGFAVDVGFVTNYNSARGTIANPIMKATIKDEAASDAMQIVIANTSSNPIPTQEIT